MTENESRRGIFDSLGLVDWLAVVELLLGDRGQCRPQPCAYPRSHASTIRYPAQQFIQMDKNRQRGRKGGELAAPQGRLHQQQERHFR